MNNTTKALLQKNEPEWPDFFAIMSQIKNKVLYGLNPVRGFIIIAILLTGLQFSFAQDSIPQGKIIDQIVAVVGGNVILQSDIEAQYEQFRAQKGFTGSASGLKCEMLETMLFQKLLMNQAELDSVEVSDAQVESELDRRLRYYISMMGSKEKFEEFYKKTVVEFKEEMREEVRDLMMVQKVQQGLSADVKITPSEVRAYYKSMPKDSLPLINSEVKLAQLVKLPPVNRAEIERVKNKLQEIRYRVLNGENFATLAILYSEDPGSAKQGGELGLFGRGEMFPEFEAAAFTLKGDTVSDIVKTDAGYHILQLIERRGEYINVRHILIRPKVSPIDLAKAKVELDSISAMIEKKTYTFDEAVKKFSDDPSKNNGGLLINPVTGSPLFESDQLDPKVFFVIDKLSKGDISMPVQFQTDDGKDAYRILHLIERTEPHQANLVDDYDRLQEWALEKKKQEVLDKWINEKIKNTYVRINDDYTNCEFEHQWNTMLMNSDAQ